MIFITGAARSGTSLTTQILQAHGCYLGRKNEVNSLYENIGVRQKVLKPYLSSVGADPRGQSVLPDTNNLRRDRDIKDRVESFFKDGPEPWAYKDAKLTLVWPVWADAFPEAKWVIVRRKSEKIVDSCIRTNFMRHHGDNKEGWLDWVKEHETRFDDMKANLNYVEVWTDEYIQNSDAFAPVTMFLGLKFNAQTVKSNIKMNMWHG